MPGQCVHAMPTKRRSWASGEAVMIEARGGTMRSGRPTVTIALGRRSVDKRSSAVASIGTEDQVSMATGTANGSANEGVTWTEEHCERGVVVSAATVELRLAAVAEAARRVECMDT